MDERDYKAMNELKMSNTEETSKLSAEEFLKTFPDNEDVVSLSLKHWNQVYEWMESFASMSVEQEKESIRQFLISEGFEMLSEKI